ncbi:MAG TPA: hypothetical protein VGO34_03790 [Alphaproteobacteria bacterium]|jgi:hypothetical protein
MTFKSLLILAGAALATGLVAAPAVAQVMGNGPYSFPARNNSFAAQAQITQRLNANGGSGSGMDALNQYIYNSSSTAIGNYSNVTVGDNANANVNGDQDSTGSQDSEATTELKSKTKVTNNNPPPPATTP